MATDVFVLKSIDGQTTVFSVDSDGNVTAAGTFSSTGTDDFGALGIKADLVAESTSNVGVTVDGTLIKDGGATLKDSVTFIVDDSDATKKVAFQASGLTTGTTRTLTIQDVSGTVYVTGGTDVAVADGGTGGSTAAAARTNLGVAIGSDVQAYNATLASIAALGTASDKGLYTTGVNTWAEFALTAAGRALLDDANAAAQRTTLGLGTSDSPTWAGATINGSLKVTGKLALTGSAVLVDAEHVDMRANYQFANTDYTTAVAQTGGLVVNYLPTATSTTTTGAGVFTAGVDGVSNPTVTTQGSGTFAATDLVMITGTANDGENDGLYEVQGHSGTTLTLKSTNAGITDRVEAFTLDQVTANAGDTGATITKVTVTVIRAGTDGIWEVGSGSQTGISYSNLVRASDAGSIFQAYDAGLASLAALPTAADKLAYSTAADTWAETALTAAARSILDDASVAAIATTLGLGTGDSPTHAGMTLGSGSLLSDEYVKATITVPNVGGGGTDALSTVSLRRADNSTVLTSARQAMIVAVRVAGQYAPNGATEASVTFGTATKGSIIASGGGWCLFQTGTGADLGEFACTISNADDETVYFAVMTPPAGVSDLTKACVVLASNSDSAAWSA